MAVTTTGPLGALDPSLTSTGTKATDTSSSQGLGQNDFLKILIEQLKHQDPENPLDDKEFASQMAQFSSLEQLISINKNLTDKGTTDSSSYASYLGRAVTLNSTNVTVDGKDGGEMKFSLDHASNVAMDLLASDGSVVSTVDLGNFEAGKHTVNLTDLPVPNGTYGFSLHIPGASGAAVELAGNPAGVVSGFIPGPNPQLLVGARQITLNDIAEVSLAE